MPENIHRKVAFIFLIFGTGLALVAVNNKIKYKVISDSSERIDKYRNDDLGIQLYSTRSVNYEKRSGYLSWSSSILVSRFLSFGGLIERKGGPADLR
jgi:hypothetical protein